MKTSKAGLKTKELWKNPEYRQHMIDVHKGKLHSGSFKKGHTLRNTGRTRFKKGQVGTRLGKKNSPEHNLKNKLARLGKPLLKTRGDKNWHWKGDDASYSAIHGWIHRTLGKAQNFFCEKCGRTETRLTWSNKNHLYKRVIDDWQVLCSKCHREYDTTVLAHIYGKRTKR